MEHLVHDAAVDQLVKVQGIGHAGRRAPHQFAVDRKKRFPHRVNQQQHRKPGRHLFIAVHQQQAGDSDEHPPQVGPSVARKNQPARVVPDQETCGGAHHTHQNPGQLAVAHLQRDIHQRQAHRQSHHACQTVVAVDDVEGMGQAGNRHKCQHHAHPGHGQQHLVQHGNTHANHGHIHQTQGQCRRQAGQHQAVQHAQALRQVFHQPTRPGWQQHRHPGAHHQAIDAQETRVVGIKSHHSSRQATDEPCKNGQPTQPGHIPRMKTLRLGITVPPRMAPRPADDQHGDKHRNNKTQAEKKNHGQ